MAADPRAPAVRVSGLSKRYGERLALDGVELTLAAGELRGLVGPNGAGKTTLLRALFGLVRPDAGELELLGRRLAPGSHRPVGGVAGFVEEPAFYPYLSGRANLELLAELDDGPATDPADVLARVGLGDRAADRVATFSTGMRQRLGIAAALMRRPRLLLLDEPTSGLDPAGIASVSALLRELAADGVAVILSSHLIGELEELCHSYSVMREGRMVWQGSAERLAVETPGSTHTLSTSDDPRALALAAGAPGIRVIARAPEPGLEIVAAREALDGYVLELARHGVAVRGLELRGSSLETMFFSLTGEGP